jgi:DNA uptake protein ComE-like DNA-binding protein
MFPFWTTPQRRAVLFLGATFWLVLAVRWASNRVYLPEGLDVPAPRAADLANRIDPNTSDWQTLAAIPSLGEKKAKLIVAYRVKATAAGRGPMVFRTALDLTRIRGIGRSTASNLEPYLMFPSRPSMTNKQGVTKPAPR